MLKYKSLKNYLFFKVFNICFGACSFFTILQFEHFFVSSMCNQVFMAHLEIFRNFYYWDMIRIIFFSKRLFFYRAFWALVGF